MPIIERHDYINSFHHVYLRGLDRFPIFHDDQDRYKFLRCIEVAQFKYGFKIHAYCLMDNHYHLYFQSLQANLSTSMHSINMSYAIYYNLKYARNGPLYEGRFKSKLVQSEKYSLNIIRYIHRNPLEAGIVNNLENYSWSSYPIYIGKKEPSGFFEFGSTINQFEAKSFLNKFRAFHRLEDEYDFFDSEPVYGDDQFMKRMLEPAIVKSYGESRIDSLIDEQLLDLLYEEIYSREILNQRESLWLYIFALQELTSLPYREIARIIDVENPDAIRQMNYRFKKVHLESAKFASIYKDLLEIKDKVVNDVNTKRYGVITRC